MSLYDQIAAGEERISVVGLGYVGMPIAVAFAKKAKVIGFDVNKDKIALYKSGIDPTREVGDETVQTTTMSLTSDEKELINAKFHIIAVPTPIHPDKTPDLSAVISASRAVGRNLQEGAIIVYESTVYPGVTEEVCVPILERESGMTCGIGFKVGYSPERINPGDKVHRLETITKIVSGMDEDSLDIIARVYSLVVEAGVYKAESIKVAEAAKVIENSQRDINIAFMNELAIIFNKIGVDTGAVLKAAATKWNFLNFRPGLVGGHCIGVDPYYLTYMAEQSGYHSQVILSGRRINDSMGKYVAENTVKALIKAGASVKKARVAVLGVTFKENVPDARNTKVVSIIEELLSYGIEPVVCDPVADTSEVYKIYGVTLADHAALKDVDAVIVAVAHDAYRALTLREIDGMFKNTAGAQKVLVDVKSLFDRRTFEASGYYYWSL
ncbi:nucleotide sugar dehydrogenase [Oscillospiraceae bacterium WX1]